MNAKIKQYIELWMSRGYPQDIPDEAPRELMVSNLAPSYKAICFCILKNDHALKGLGFEPKASPWYGVLKRIELDARPGREKQLNLKLR